MTVAGEAWVMWTAAFCFLECSDLLLGSVSESRRVAPHCSRNSRRSSTGGTPFTSLVSVSHAVWVDLGNRQTVMKVVIAEAVHCPEFFKPLFWFRAPLKNKPLALCMMYYTFLIKPFVQHLHHLIIMGICFRYTAE